jgi:hypothetical protein
MVFDKKKFGMMMIEKGSKVMIFNTLYADYFPPGA